MLIPMKRVLLGSLLALSAAPAWANPMPAPTDKLIDGARLCTRSLPRFEREYGIPVHLLSAIASTESGRYHQGLKIALPWPWTINAEGKGYYYDSKAEAVAAAKKFRAAGIRSMDVGCMQVNLLHHANAFASLEDAFEPDKNIAYGASFLRGLYEEMRSWKSAASAYHSRTPSFGAQYVSRVYDRWYSIIDRVRGAAKGGAPAPVQVASLTAPANTPLPLAPVTQPVQFTSAPQKPTPKPLSIKNISVREVGSAPVLLLRADSPKPTAVLIPPPPKELKVSSVQAEPQAPDARVVKLANPPPARNAPRFIFSD